MASLLKVFFKAQSLPLKAFESLLDETQKITTTFFWHLKCDTN